MAEVDAKVTVGDREFQKFEKDADGNMQVRTAGVIKDATTNYKAKVHKSGAIAVEADEVHDGIDDMKNLLKEILMQLKIITGEDR